MANSVRLIDSTLRDGTHAMAHQFTPERCATSSAALDDAGVDTSSRSRTAMASAGRRSTTASRRAGVRPDQGCGRDRDKVEAGGAAAARHRHARRTCASPRTYGVKRGAHRHALHRGRRLGQHIALTKELGMEAVGFLMMAHMISPAGAAVPGAADGELRRRLRLRHRLGRRADAGRLPRARADSARGPQHPGRRARAQQPRARRGEQPGGGRARARPTSTAAAPGWAPARATRRSRSSPRCSAREGIDIGGVDWFKLVDATDQDGAADHAAPADRSTARP